MPHYSIAQNVGVLSSWSRDSARNIHRTFSHDDNITALIYSGMSGIALATAVQLAYYSEYEKKLQMIYVRKENEFSHGNAVEFNFIPYESGNNTNHNLIFVDDFIDTGDTIVRCLDAFAEHYQPFYKLMGVPYVTDVFYINEYNTNICRVSEHRHVNVQDAYAKVEKVKIEK